MICEPDPAIARDLGHIRHSGGVGPGVIVSKIAHFLVFDIIALIILLPDGPLMQDIEILEIWGFAKPFQPPLGGQAPCGIARVGDRLGNGEHVILINRKGPLKRKALAIVPAQNHRLAGGKGAAAGLCPGGSRAGDIGKIKPAARCPAKKRLIAMGLGLGDQQLHDI